MPDHRDPVSFTNKMGKKLKKTSKKETGIEGYGYDEVDEHFDKTYDNNEDFIRLKDKNCEIEI